MKLFRVLRRSVLVAGVLLLFSPPASSQITLPDAKPVPRMQVVPLPHAQASIQRDGKEITRYHFAGSLRRPFLYPIIGPSGRSLTRMGHPHEFARLARAIVETPMLNGGTIRLDAGQRFAPK